ncbi:MAG: flagellar basal body rod protein FlgB [Gammaproteobacteria bacterium]|nr:flagellar basal body rod protein FlgB [Gammaproteobacteria bacterium]MDH5800646.1 flagellar basal body rod protein FlgB [Gammaproteobacteria bacterium]
MIDDLGGYTSQLVKAALDVASYRHKVISNNIANANTPGFTPSKVGFEEYLQSVSMGYMEELGALNKEQLQQLVNRVTSGDTTVMASGEKVELDQQMADLSENVLKYRALLLGLEKRGAIMKMAVSQKGV